MESKAQVRRRHRAQRANLSEQEARRRALGLTEALRSAIRPGTVVAGYIPMRGEPDVLPFLSAHVRERGQVWMPVVADAEARILQWVQWSEKVELRRSALVPVHEPTGARVATTQLLADAAHDLTVLVPAVALDRRGGRLGQGGGFYDTMFAQHPERSRSAQLIAIVYDEEILEVGSFPVEEHDLRAQRAATPSGIFELSGSARKSV